MIGNQLNRNFKLLFSLNRTALISHLTHQNYEIEITGLKFNAKTINCCPDSDFVDFLILENNVAVLKLFNHLHCTCLSIPCHMA